MDNSSTSGVILDVTKRQAILDRRKRDAADKKEVKKCARSGISKTVAALIRTPGRVVGSS